MAAISSLPGIGKKRAAKIVLSRPVKNADELADAVGDVAVAERLLNIIAF
jgi:DNA uptake protein ComE-like DNA-binding protein